MKKFALGIVVAVVMAFGFAGAYRAGMQKGAMNAATAESAAPGAGGLAPLTSLPAGDPCAGRAFCAVAYLAPWCPHCKNAVPELQKMTAKAEQEKSPGLKVLVGAGKPGENESMARVFGKSGIVDASGDKARQLSVAYYPTFLVVDREGTVILRDGEAMHWMQEKLL